MTMNLGVLKLPAPPLVMGVLNITEESAKLGSKHAKQSLVDHMLTVAEQMLTQGTDIIDVSCDHMRGGKTELSLAEEKRILLPVVEALTQRFSIPICIDTSHPEIMLAAADAGVKIINDVHALTKLGALSQAGKINAAICLMHMQNDPVNTQRKEHVVDVVSEVYNFLEQRIAACVESGIDRNRIIIDPGFGYGKTLPQNITILRSLHVFKNLNCPILVDLAHKSMIGQLTDATIEHRAYGGLAAEIIAISRGADIIRSHDVQATVDAIKVIKAVASQ